MVSPREPGAVAAAAMIASLRGVVLHRSLRGDHPSGELLVEVAGVGYRVQAPATTVSRAGEIGSAVFLHVHTYVREDALVLYGFARRDERAAFETLIATHGVGPSVALALLSAHTPAALARIVATDDTASLTAVAGIGAKTASRLLVELKNRLDVDNDSALSAVAGAAGGSRFEVRAALAGLGYGADDVRHILGALPADGTTEELLRGALRQLAAVR